MLQAAPTIQKNKYRDNGNPSGLLRDGEGEESYDADEADDGGSQQAAGTAEEEPEQGTENLATIEGIDGKHVEDKKADIDPEDIGQK